MKLCTWALELGTIGLVTVVGGVGCVVGCVVGWVVGCVVGWVVGCVVGWVVGLVVEDEPGFVVAVELLLLLLLLLLLVPVGLLVQIGPVEVGSGFNRQPARVVASNKMDNAKAAIRLKDIRIDRSPFDGTGGNGYNEYIIS